MNLENTLLSSRLYCRFWNLTKSTAMQVADYTAGREFHPAPKNYYFISLILKLFVKKVNMKNVFHSLIL